MMAMNITRMPLSFYSRMGLAAEKSGKYFNMLNVQLNRNKSEDKKQMGKILQLEMDVLRQEGHRVPNPETLREEHWGEILSLNSKSARRKYYSFLWQIEKKRENKLVRKERHKASIIQDAKIATSINENQHAEYGLSRVTFFLRIYDTTINMWNNSRLIQAILFGPKIVFDCSYDEFMTKRECINAAKQLMLCFATNRIHKEPFDIHFCNVDLQGTTMKYLEKHIPTMHESWFPLNLHEQCFTDIFVKKKIVYLSPHCKENLETFDPEDVYIIGCMVDKVNSEPLSLAKAKKLGLRMARLPLDKYLQWRPGSGKSLTLNQVLDVLLDLKESGDWRSALKHVPVRKTDKSISYTARTPNKELCKENS